MALMALFAIIIIMHGSIFFVVFFKASKFFELYQLGLTLNPHDVNFWMSSCSEEHKTGPFKKINDIIMIRLIGYLNISCHFTFWQGGNIIGRVREGGV